MFGKKKHLEDFEDEELKRKKSNRPTFGFRCSPVVHVSAKELALKLHVDLGVLAEHALHLGLMDVASAMKDPEEAELLRQHLHEEHSLKHLVESVSKRDEEAAEYIREGQVRRYHREKAVRDLVELWARNGLEPLLMKEIILSELKRVTDFSRSRAAQNDQKAKNT